MDNYIKKIAYLKGLAEGLDVESEGNTGKVLVKLIEAIDALADEVEDLAIYADEIDARLEDNEDVVDMICEDYYDEYFDDDDDDDEDYDDDDLFDEFDEFDDDDMDSDFFEIECPSCHEDVMIDFDTIDENDEIICPNCKEKIILEFECDCDECDD